MEATSLGMAGLSPRVPSHRPPDARAALADPKLPPVRRQPETPSAPRPPAGAQPGEVAPRPRGPRGRSLPKFVNSWRWREGAAPNFRAERRGEGGAITHRSPRRRRRRRAARRKARPAGGGPACCAPVGGGAAGGGPGGTGDRAVQTAGSHSSLLDRNKSGSAAPPTGPRAPPRPAQRRTRGGAPQQG